MQVSNEVLNVLSECRFEGNLLYLADQLERSMYMSVNKVLESAGGKWDRKAKAHVFNKDAAIRVDEIILTGTVDLPKNEFNYFPTPSEIVDILITRAAIGEGMRVLEPSAGQGSIALACARVGARVDCVELMKENVNVLSENSQQLGTIIFDDFLKITPSPDAEYDAVVMNPPFTKQQDIHHVLHAYRFLKRGGRLVAVMSSSVSFRENKLTQQFRDFVSANNGNIIPLPEASFKSSGTLVNTVIVIIPKDY
jgi:predicted RNA methylase